MVNHKYGPNIYIVPIIFTSVTRVASLFIVSTIYIIIMMIAMIYILMMTMTMILTKGRLQQVVEAVRHRTVEETNVLLQDMFELISCVTTKYI